MKDLIVVKIGTNVLTDGSGLIRKDLIEDIANQLSSLADKFSFVIVTSGAVGIGKSIRQDIREKDPVMQRQVFAGIGQGHLYSIYENAFLKNGITTSQKLFTKLDLREGDTFRAVGKNLKCLIRYNVIPIINENDTVSWDENTFGDNDQLAALTASLLEAKRLIILSDTEGLYTGNPKINKNVQLVRVVDKIDNDILNFCKDLINTNGRGGMFSKISAARIATSHGVQTHIALGSRADVIADILADKEVGTKFLADKPKKLKLRGTWMKMLANISGEARIDSGAVKALKDNKSLLMVGVKSVSGKFEKGDVILVKSETGLNIAVGIAEIGQQSIDNISEETKEKGKLLIHKDHLYLLES